MDVHEQSNVPPPAGIRFGRYRLLDELGEGGMAVVYRALMEGPDGFSKMVALKLIHGDFSRDAGLMGQCVSEARLGGVLSHPNIVEILDYGKEQGRFYLAMEYVDGPTLSQVIRYQRKQRARIPVGVVLEMLAQVCRGLGYAHRATDLEGRPLRLVHRDLKPSNVLVNLHGVTKIADFGVARAETNVLRTVTNRYIKGTGPYMSPEQAWGSSDLDHRSDLFSAGIILFELLALDFLYEGRTIEVALRQAQDADVVPRFVRIPPSPHRDALIELLSRALAKNPDERYQTGDEMADALEALRATVAATGSLRRWLATLGPDWRALPGIDAVPARILFPPGGGDAAWTNFAETSTPAASAPGPSGPETLAGDPSRGGAGKESRAGDPPGRGSQRSSLQREPTVVMRPESGQGPFGTPDPRATASAGATRDVIEVYRRGAATRFGGSRLLLAALVSLLLLGTVVWWFLAGPASKRDTRPGDQGVKDVATGTRLEDAGRRTDGSAIESVDLLAGTPPGGAEPDVPAATAPPGHASGSESAGANAGTGLRPLPGSRSVENKGGKAGTGRRSGGSTAAHGSSSPSAAASRKGILSLNSSPRSRIMLDHVSLAGFPVRDMTVSPGEHTIVFTTEAGEQLLHHVFVAEGARITCTALFSQSKVVCRELNGG